MENVLFTPAFGSNPMRVAKVVRSNQKFTYVQELACSYAERYLAAMWLSVAPEKRYSNKEFTSNFREMNEEERV